MPFFRRKSFVIHAEQWFPDRIVPGVRRIPANRVDLSKTRGILVDRPERHVCDTLHGEVEVYPGCWIIAGLRNEYYPCDPDIFAASYEEIIRPAAVSIGRSSRAVAMLSKLKELL